MKQQIEPRIRHDEESHPVGLTYRSDAPKRRLAGRIRGVDMADEERQCWWVRLRRSLGIPDLMSDYHARTVIVRRLMKEYPTELVADSDVVVGEMVDNFVDLAAMGAFDAWLLVDDDERRWLLQDKDVDPIFEVYKEPTMTLGTLTPDTITALRSVVLRMTDAVRDHTQRAPLEASSSAYFA
jgi:hypothetical protein